MALPILGDFSVAVSVAFSCLAEQEWVKECLALTLRPVLEEGTTTWLILRLMHAKWVVSDKNAFFHVDYK